MRVEGAPPGYRLFVGVDIAAETASVAWPEAGASAGPAVTIEQSPQGVAALRRRLMATGHAPAEVLVVLEATGSSWLSLATALADAGFAVSVINAMQAHHFAKPLLRLDFGHYGEAVRNGACAYTDGVCQPPREERRCRPQVRTSSSCSPRSPRPSRARPSPTR
jgi:hypothetical protein